MNTKYKYGAIIIGGHVQGLSNTRSLGEIGIPVYVVDTSDCIARYSKYCRKFFKCPAFIADEFADFLIEMAIKENLTDWLLLPSNDHAVFTISKHKNELEKYYKVITPGLEIIQNIYDKRKLIKFASASSIAIPVTYPLITDYHKLSFNPKFPVLIKGRYSLSFYRKFGKKVFLANNNDQFDYYLRIIRKKEKSENIIVQELIPFDGTNWTVSFTSFCENGRIRSYWMGEKLREHPSQFGTASFAKSVLIEDCYNISVKLLEKLNYHGVCEIEYIKDPRDDQYKLIEINARTWLWVGLAKAAGVNYPKLIYDYFFSDKITPPQTYETQLKWINWTTDIPYSVYNILRGRIKLKEYIESLKGIKIRATFDKNDILPSVAYCLLINSFLRNR